MDPLVEILFWYNKKFPKTNITPAPRSKTPFFSEYNVLSLSRRRLVVVIVVKAAKTGPETSKERDETRRGLARYKTIKSGRLKHTQR